MKKLYFLQLSAFQEQKKKSFNLKVLKEDWGKVLKQNKSIKSATLYKTSRCVLSGINRPKNAQPKRIANQNKKNGQPKQNGQA